MRKDDFEKGLIAALRQQDVRGHKFDYDAEFDAGREYVDII